MKADVIVGLQWGDEGKGKIVDFLAPRYQLIARFQGGPNAGHTIAWNGNKMVLHTVPSGILHGGIQNLIGSGVVIDPVGLCHELDLLKKMGAQPTQNLLIARRSHLILPSHRMLDACYENAPESTRIGSTLKGISPAYTDRYARRGIRSGDIFSPDFMKMYRELRDHHFRLMSLYSGNIEQFVPGDAGFDETEKHWLDAVAQMKEIRQVDGEIYIHESLRNNMDILAEGAQGALLDIDFGSYPFVTSSHTIASGACTGLGIPPQIIDRVIGVFKAYCTRVGEGPFPTETDDENGDLLRNKGNEYGSTTGRPRRCGWLDIPALSYSIMLNGVTDLAMMKADVLDSFSEIKVCRAYQHDGALISYPPFDMKNGKLTPVYESIPGWMTDTRHIRSAGGLPPAFSDYVDFIEKSINVPVSVISLGPDRDQTIEMLKP